MSSEKYIPPSRRPGFKPLIPTERDYQRNDHTYRRDVKNLPIPISIPKEPFLGSTDGPKPIEPKKVSGAWATTPKTIFKENKDEPVIEVKPNMEILPGLKKLQSDTALHGFKLAPQIQINQKKSKVELITHNTEEEGEEDDYENDINEENQVLSESEEDDNEY